MAACCGSQTHPPQHDDLRLEAVEFDALSDNSVDVRASQVGLASFKFA
jgi:hypothetical protein